MPTMA